MNCLTVCSYYLLVSGFTVLCLFVMFDAYRVNVWNCNDRLHKSVRHKDARLQQTNAMHSTLQAANVLPSIIILDSGSVADGKHSSRPTRPANFKVHGNAIDVYKLSRILCRRICGPWSLTLIPFDIFCRYTYMCSRLHVYVCMSMATECIF